MSKKFDLQVSEAVNALQRGGRDAARLFRDEFDPVAKAAVRADPKAALMLCKPLSIGKGGLLVGERARVVEVVVGEHTNEQAHELLSDHIATVHLGDLLLLQGDLPSSMFVVASKEAVLAALRKELKDEADGRDLDAAAAASTAFDALGSEGDPGESEGDGEGEYSGIDDMIPFADLDASIMARILAWGRKLSERDDFRELLEEVVAQGVSLKAYLFSAIFHEIQGISEDEDEEDEDEEDEEGDAEAIDGDFFDHRITELLELVGLNEELQEEYLEFVEEGDMILTTDDMLRAAQKDLRAARERVRQEVTSFQEAEQASADDDDDLI
ncbi:MAG: hypothetical protein ABIA47_00320 [bacterium]